MMVYPGGTRGVNLHTAPPPAVPARDPLISLFNDFKLTPGVLVGLAGPGAWEFGLLTLGCENSVGDDSPPGVKLI